MTANAPLPGHVDILSKSIRWTVVFTGGHRVPLRRSGPHRIYVTYGKPEGSVVTERRVSDVCEAAKGKTTLDDCAKAISLHLKSFRYSLAPEALPNGPPVIWLLHAGSQYKSQCPGLALFIRRHFNLLGLGDGPIAYCHATATGGYVAELEIYNHVFRPCTPLANGHPASSTHHVYATIEPLMHIDGGGKRNKFEAVCYFNSKYYAVGVGDDGVFASAKDVVKTAFPGPAGIRWCFITDENNTTDLMQDCTFNLWSEAP
jgi:hypothetical protein